MNKFLKLTGLFALLAASMAMVGCQQTTTAPATVDEQAIAEYNQQVLDTDAAAVMTVVKSKQTISKKISLPTVCANGSTVTWVSSDESVIKSDGSLPAIKNGGLNEDGSLPTATLTATISYENLTTTYTVNVTVKRLDEDAEKVYAARQALLTMYEGKELSGYDEEFTSDGDIKYILPLTVRDDVNLVYSSTDRIKVCEDGENAIVARPLESELSSGKTYVTDKIVVDINGKAGTSKAHLEIVCMISEGQELITMKELKEAMAADGWASENAAKTEYLFVGTVSLVWESATSYQGFYLQKDGYGLYVYSAGISDVCERVSEGDEVAIAATTTIYSGLPETSSVSMVKIITKAADNAENIAKAVPLEVTAENFNATDMTLKDGLVASVAKLVYIKGTMTTNSSATLTFRILGAENNVTVSCGKYTTDFENIKTFVNGLKTGDIVEVSKCAIGWYSSNPQLVFTNSKYLSKSTATLTNQEKVTLDEQLTSLSIAAFIAPGESYTLPSSTFGSSINWTVDNADYASIVDGKLVAASFTESGSVKVTAVFECGEGDDKVTGTKQFEFEIPALKPLTYAEAVAAYEAGTLPEKFATTLNVYDKVGNVYVASANGTDYIKLDSKVALTLNSSSTVLVSKVEKSGSVYTFTVESAPGVTALDTYYTGENMTVETLSVSNLTKVALTNVTIVNGAVAQSDTVNIKFYTDFSNSTAYADGTYGYLEGYAYAVDDSTIAYVVCDFTTIADINAMYEAAAKNPSTVTFVGLVVAIMSSGSVLAADNSGNAMTIYLASSYRSSVVVGKFYAFTGETAQYNSIIQISESKVAPVLAGDKSGVAPYGFEEVAAGAIEVTGDDYNVATANDNARHVYKVTGLTYDASTTDSYNNVYMKSANGTSIKVVNYSSNFGQADDYTAYLAKVTAAKGTITLFCVDNIYTSSGTLNVQAYPIVELVEVDE